MVKKHSAESVQEYLLLYNYLVYGILVIYIFVIKKYFFLENKVQISSNISPKYLIVINAFVII